MTSFLYYLDYDSTDEQTPDLYRQGISAFGGISPTYRMALEKDSPVILCDFHSLLVNRKEKHMIDAVYGWYRYDIRFALPVYDDKTGEVARHNIYSASMLARHANDGNKYLYDILAIKKETSSPLEGNFTVKTHFLLLIISHFFVLSIPDFDFL